MQAYYLLRIIIYKYHIFLCWLINGSVAVVIVLVSGVHVGSTLAKEVVSLYSVVKNHDRRTVTENFKSNTFDRPEIFSTNNILFAKWRVLDLHKSLQLQVPEKEKDYNSTITFF